MHLPFSSPVRYTVVDTFTTTSFSGNPAATFFIDSRSPLSDETLQRLAREFNLPTCSFLLITPPSPPSSFHSSPEVLAVGVRWFTPTSEIQLSGHGMLAAAYTLLYTMWPYTVIHFETFSGVLTATRNHTHSDTIDLELPAGLTKRADSIVVEKVKNALTKALEVGDVDHLVKSIVVGIEKTFADATLIELDSSIDLASLVVDPQPFTDLAPTHTIFTLHTTAPSSSPYTFISRTFAPSIGVPEDPVTGVMHSMLGPYWHTRLGLAQGAVMRGRQVSKRGGEMDVMWDEEKGRCRLGGKAVFVGQGDLSELAKGRELR